MLPLNFDLELVGEHAILTPLNQGHLADLQEAVSDGRLWELWYTLIPPPEKMSAEIDRRLHLQKSGSMQAFAVLLPGSRKAVGMTTYMNIDSANKHVEIGSTWYRRSVQRSALNTECKWLLLRHAFEVYGCIAVEFRTHRFNSASRAAIERLGAQLDGILRSHQISPNGSVRDTAVYSIIRSEWPMVKAHLEYQLQR
ncbi:MAG: GNAT family protein [Gammaproteobacteria bacterium]|nr:GNAT family protein [Gammaproteobacteria bacterium]